MTVNFVGAIARVLYRAVAVGLFLPRRRRNDLARRNQERRAVVALQGEYRGAFIISCCEFERTRQVSRIITRYVSRLVDR